MQGLKAQASMELISILGISLIVILVFSVLSSDFLTGIAVNRNYADAQSAVQKLANAADTVYAQGEGASEIVQVKIPSNANMSSAVSYIGKPPGAPAGATSNVISIRVGGSDVLAITRETVAGSLPLAPGTYNMKVVSRGNYVAIGTHYLDADKNSVYQSMAPGETRSETITFTATGNETVGFNVTYSWSYPNVGISLNASYYSVPPGASRQINVTFTPNSAAAGLYNSQLNINATAGNGVTEAFSIPIAADVQSH